MSRGLRGEEITDEESARAWLKDRPREVQVAFAARAALRALPGIATEGAATLNRIALPVLRAILTSTVSTVRRTDDVKTAAESADLSALSADYSAASAALSAAAAAVPSALSAYSAADSASSAAESAVLSALSADSADLSAPLSAAWAAADRDAGNLGAKESPDLVFHYTLWPEAALPEGLDGALAELQSFWAKNPQTWDFWARWYAGMLAGTPLPWDLQEAVALIADEDWDAGPERVAKRIREIEDDFADATSPTDRSRRQAERLLSRAAMNALTAQESAKLFQSAVSSNSLPPEFDAFRATPAILFAMAASLQTHAERVAGLESDLQTSEQSVHALAQKVAELEDNIEALTRELERAKGKSKRELFGEVAVSTSAKILTTAFWGATIAGIGHLAGYADIADLLDRLHNAVTELPVGPLDEGES
mgnify:CR=1 FL=1